MLWKFHAQHPPRESVALGDYANVSLVNSRKGMSFDPINGKRY